MAITLHLKKILMIGPVFGDGYRTTATDVPIAGSHAAIVGSYPNETERKLVRIGGRNWTVEIDGWWVFNKNANQRIN